MTETGKIVELNSKTNTAKVQFSRKSACENCKMCLMAKNDMFVYTTVQNTLGASVGDTVTVQMAKQFVMTSVLVVYLIPLLLLMVALVSTRNLAVGIQVGCAFSALAVGLIISVLVDRKIRKNNKFQPKMVEIITIE